MKGDVNKHGEIWPLRMALEKRTRSYFLHTSGDFETVHSERSSRQDAGERKEGRKDGGKEGRRHRPVAVHGPQNTSSASTTLFRAADSLRSVSTRTGRRGTNAFLLIEKHSDTFLYRLLQAATRHRTTARWSLQGNIFSLFVI